MLHIINMAMGKSRIRERSRKIRSASSNPNRNRLEKTDVARDWSVCAVKSTSKSSEPRMNRSVGKTRTLLAVIPIARKSVLLVAKALTKRSQHGAIRELCRVCCDPAQIIHSGVFLCLSCKVFLDEHAFKQDTVNSNCSPQ